MNHIFLVGACYLDTILSVPHYPSEDSKLRAQTLSTRRGGNCPNTLHVLSQLLEPPSSSAAAADGGGGGNGSGGTALHLVSCLPDAGSAATAKIEASFSAGEEKAGAGGGGGGAGAVRKGGVDLSTCIYRKGVEEAASSFIIRSVETGSRTIVNYNGVEEMSVGEFRGVVGGVVGGCEGGVEGSWWHFEGRIPATTLQCIRHLRQVLPSATVSVEVEKPGRDGLAELAEAADVVFYSRTWAEHKGHDDAATCLERETPPTASLALCTWGSAGATAYLPADKEIVECDVRDTSGGRGIDVVDTIGAGDTFIAGMLHGLTRHRTDWDTRARLRFAVDLATLKVQREGFGGLGRDMREQMRVL